MKAKMMVRCNLQCTGDATRIKSMAVITMHPKPPYLPHMFISDLNEMSQTLRLNELTAHNIERNVMW